MANQEEIVHQLDELDRHYRARFAGHSRVSRDPDELIDLQGKLKDIRESAEGLGESVLTRITEASDLYAKELTLITDARTASPAAVPAHRLAQWANLVFARYTRHFAGQSRTTRDPELLEEFITDLREFRNELAGLQARDSTTTIAENISNIDRSIESYEREVQAVRSAQAAGSMPEVGGRLAGLANSRFDVYRLQFAGKSRLSRQPAMLKRILRSLKQIHAAMLALRTRGMTDAAHAKNIQVVGERMDAFQKELTAIEQVRKGNTTADRISALGGAANDVFSSYREHFAGQDRASRELTKLDELLDLLYPVAREMDELDRYEGDDINARNLSIVLDQLRSYERERLAIFTAQAS